MSKLIHIEDDRGGGAIFRYDDIRAYHYYASTPEFLAGDKPVDWTLVIERTGVPDSEFYFMDKTSIDRLVEALLS